MRGIAEATLVALILAITAGLVLAGIAGVFVAKGKGFINKEACRVNALGAAKSADLFPLTNCYTENKGALDYSGDAATYESEVSRQVATMLADCKYQLAETPQLPYKGSIFTDGSVCFVCATFQLPEGAPQGVQGKLILSSFQTWLKNNNRGTQTYAEYLLPAVPFKDLNYLFLDYFSVEQLDTKNTNIVSLAKILFPKETQYAITLEQGTADHPKEYAVIHYGLTQPKGNYIGAFIENALGTDIYAKKLAQGVNTIGDTTYTTGEVGSVFIMPFDNIAQTCEVTMVRYP